MELNKYDLVEFLSHKLKVISCLNCPIREECKNKDEVTYICFDEDETKELLMKKIQFIKEIK